MRQKLLKAAFVVSVLVLWMTLFFSSLAAIEILFPIRRGPDGLYPSTDRMPMGIVAMGFSLWLANWVMSFAFHASGIMTERWSVFIRRHG